MSRHVPPAPVPDHVVAPVFYRIEKGAKCRGKRVDIAVRASLAVLTPDDLRRAGRYISQCMCAPWRKDHETQICRDWYRGWVVEYFVGSAHGICLRLNTRIEWMGWERSDELVLWLLDIRPGTDLEYRDRFEGR